jgi:hypothetical protein
VWNERLSVRAALYVMFNFPQSGAHSERYKTNGTKIRTRGAISKLISLVG